MHACRKKTPHTFGSGLDQKFWEAYKHCNDHAGNRYLDSVFSITDCLGNCNPFLFALLFEVSICLQTRP